MSPDGGPVRILVVDDQPELAELLATVLEEDDRSVDTAHGGQAALERLASQGYDLVVCDLQMPEVDGVAVYRAVAEREPPRPAVVFITGGPGAGAYADFLQTTAVPVLSKPVGVQALRQQVDQLLAARGSAADPGPIPQRGHS